MAKNGLADFPKDSRAYNVLAVINLNMNRLQVADSLCRVSLQLDSLDQRAYSVLSRSVFKKPTPSGC